MSHDALSFPSSRPVVGGSSSVGRAGASQAPGRRFEPDLPLSAFPGGERGRRASAFTDEEIFADLGAAHGSRVEFFDGAAYSFRRLGRVEGLDRQFVKRLMNARWRNANPEAVRAYWRAWRAANPDRARAYVNRYAKSAKGRAVAKAKKRRWQRRNRDAYNAAQRAAYARRKAAKS